MLFGIEKGIEGGFDVFDSDFSSIMMHPFGESYSGITADKSVSVSSDDDFEELERRDKKVEKEEKKKHRLSKEYEDSFDGDDKLVHRLLRIKSKIDISLKKISIDDIITSKFKKLSRDETVVGLAGVVSEWGVVTPIHVLSLETEDTYLLLDGLRRVFAAMRGGVNEISAMVWDFSDKQEGKDMANVISLMVNRSQRYSSKELWEQMQLLEDVNDVGPGLIEYLLQMNSGDAMKLKDVMLSDGDYEEIKKGLLGGTLTIESAYKKLCTARKKEDKLSKEDNMSIENEQPGSRQRLGVDEVKQLLELTDEDISSIDTEDMDRTDEARGDVVQNVGDRSYIDQATKQATLIRDNFACRCCGRGGAHNLAILVYHHLVPVFLGGPDTVDNGLTMCVSCHIVLHSYSMGKVRVKLDDLSKEDKVTFRNILRFGNIIIEGVKRLGVAKDDFVKESASSLRHPYPGEGLNDNISAFKTKEFLDRVAKDRGTK